MDNLTKTFYVVRNKEGKYLHSKGYNGSGECWVEGLEKAKVWSRPGPAKAQRTWWLEHYPCYGAPDVVPLVATLGEPLSLNKGSLKKALKDLAAIRTEKKEIENLRGRHTGHAQDGVNNYLSRIGRVTEQEGKQLRVVQMLEVLCTPV